VPGRLVTRKYNESGARFCVGCRAPTCSIVSNSARIAEILKDATIYFLQPNIHYVIGKPGHKKQLGDAGVDGRIILKSI
jgi:hypothetical protein